MIETKLINTIEEDLSNGIFITIYNKHIFDWLSQNDAQNLDIEYYYNRSGEKYISPLFDKLIKSSNYIDKLSNIIVTMFRENWNKIYKAYIDSNYNPIHNYDMNEEEVLNGTRDVNIDNTSTNESKNSVKMKTTTSNDNNQNYYGFNSDLPVPTNSSNSQDENLVEGNLEDNKTNVNSQSNSKTKYAQNNDRTLVRKGNIGVKTTQSMIEEELELRRKNFFNMLMNNIDEILTLNIY